MAGVQKMIDKYLEESVSQIEDLLAGKIEMEKEEKQRHLGLIYKIVFSVSELLEPLETGKAKGLFAEHGLSWMSELSLTFRGRSVRQVVLEVIEWSHSWSIQHFLHWSCK